MHFIERLSYTLFDTLFQVLISIYTEMSNVVRKEQVSRRRKLGMYTTPGREAPNGGNMALVIHRTHCRVQEVG